MSSIQADLSRFRAARVDTAVVSSGPTDGVTEPHFTMSPQASSGMQSTGFLLMLKAPSSSAAVDAGGGFSVTPWVRDPVSGRWGSGETTAIAYDQAFVTYDVDAAQLYFQIAGAGVNGLVDVHLSEQ